MIQVQKKRYGKNFIAIIITAAVLALLIAGYIVVDAIIKSGIADPADQTQSKPIELIDGEAYHNGVTPVMYPSTSSTKITRVTVSAYDFEGFDGFFSIAREEDGMLYYYYRNESGDAEIYYPPICVYEDGFEYTSLYAATDDGMNAYKLSYLFAALAVPYFDERIELVADESGQYGKQLAAYGLDEEHRDAITVTYLDGNNKEATYTIYIGNKLVNGVGYYLQIAGRNYVYASSSAENMKYALDGFASFISPTITMAGGDMDNAQVPLLTTSYKQWKNVLFDSKDEWGKVKDVLDCVKDGTEVVITAKIKKPLGDTLDKDGVNEGYSITVSDKISIDLESLAKRASFDNFRKAIIGKAVKSYEENPLLATVISPTLAVKFAEGADSVTYTYKITAIESVIADGAEYTEGAVGENSLIKVKYNYLVDGEEPESQIGILGHQSYAIIDLTDERIPLSVREYLAGEDIGAVKEANATFDVTYTKANATKRTGQYVINDITVISEIKGDDIVVVDTVTENSIVTYSYTLLSSDGKTSEVIKEGVETIALSEIKADDELYQAVKAALIGQSVKRDYNKLAYEYEAYYQLAMDFETYEISSIDYFVSRELITAFKFVNQSDRDAFFSEAIHKNDLPEGHKYANYAIDWASCEYVAKVLGGIGVGSSSTNFEGLKGNKVVDVGLTPENMEEYGLYAYTIYFELPRAIFAVGDDFEWLSKTGFTLYISEKRTDGTRLVGTDMYDTIVEIDGDVLYFIEESFIDFWARRDLVMIDYTKLNNLSVNVNFNEFKGKYDFKVDHPEAWITPDGLTFTKPDSSTSSEVYNAINVFASVSGDFSDTKLSQYIGLYGQNFPLGSVYNLAAGITGGMGLTVGYDTAGDSNFKDFLRALYSVSYVGSLTEEEIADAKSREAVLTLSFKVEQSSAYEYAYDFHYTSEGKVAVVMYRIDTITGARHSESCNFYISNFALKKIVNALSDLANGVYINVGEGFRDY